MALDLNTQLWELGHKACYKLDERLGTITRLRVVLNVFRPDVLRHRLCRLLVVERSGVELDHRVFVARQVTHGILLVTLTVWQSSDRHVLQGQMWPPSL